MTIADAQRLEHLQGRIYVLAPPPQQAGPIQITDGSRGVKRRIYSGNS
jgi:hypothetical protein